MVNMKGCLWVTQAAHRWMQIEQGTVRTSVGISVPGMLTKHPMTSAEQKFTMVRIFGHP